MTDALLKKSLIGNIIFYTCIVILIYLIYQMIVPILDYQVYFNWWNTNKGDIDPQSTFDMISLAYYESFMLYYQIRTLLIPAQSSFQHTSWAILIKTIMTGGAIGIVEGGQVTPKDLCVSIVPDVPVNTSELSAYPTTNSTWKPVIQKWAGISDDDLASVIAGTMAYSDAINTNTWNNNNNDSTNNNFFWVKYAIPVDSPVIIAYLTNLSSYNGDPLYPSLVQFLIGLGTGSGGWWGFCQVGGSFGDRGYAEISRQLWSDDIPSNFSDTTTVSNSCISAGNLSSAATSGISLGVMGAMIPGFGAIAAPLLFAVGAGTSMLGNCL
ncbi:MAG: hypothetical protein JKX76_01015 [Colwellia sp.]|nr:hypothetical protein [Colwellia sp.]